MSTALTFEPVFFPRVWGGRALEAVYGKRLPASRNIGESWELVDRPEAQSVVRDGPWRGRSLHDLWVNEREEVFGAVADTPRFPLLIKLLDCREILSLQVHPPAKVAASLGGEEKTEAWYIARAEEGAELCLGLKEGVNRENFAQALTSGRAAECVNRVRTRRGQLYFVPSGQVHAIGAGNLILEVQQNSDTTYRVFDWNRVDEKGEARELHLAPALSAIDFTAAEDRVLDGENEMIEAGNYFKIERVRRGGEFSPKGKFAVGFVSNGRASCAGARFRAGELFLLPARTDQRDVVLDEAELLRITIP